MITECIKPVYLRYITFVNSTKVNDGTRSMQSTISIACDPLPSTLTTIAQLQEAPQDSEHGR